MAWIVLAFLLESCTDPGSWAEVDEQYRYVLSGRAWKQRMAISIDSTGITEELTNFPLLVTLNPADLDKRACGTGGREMQFRDSDGTTILAHEVGNWNIVGDSRVWVRVPRIPANTLDTRIWLYFDNPYASEPDRSGEVWSNGFLGVWHLDEEEPGTYSDATSERWDGGPGGGSFTLPAPAEGRIGGAQEFEESTDAILFPARPGIDLVPFTFSFWIRPVSLPNGRRLFNKGPLDIRSSSAGPPHRLSLELGFDDGNPVSNPDSLLLEQPGELEADAQWYWYCLAWTGTGECGTGDDTLDGAHVYRNGVLRSGNRGVQRDGTGAYSGDEGDPAYLGNRAWNNGAILGRLDEVRLSGVRRSPAWILAEYRSMTGTLATLGVPETVPYE
jgi:hypothetical protein